MTTHPAQAERIRSVATAQLVDEGTSVCLRRGTSRVVRSVSYVRSRELEVEQFVILETRMHASH